MNGSPTMNPLRAYSDTERLCEPQLYPRRCRGLYRAFGAVISALRAGYVLLPLAAKLRSARRARTFFIDGVHKGGAALSLPFGEDGAVLKPCSNRAQAKFCRAQNGAQNKKSRKPALLKAPFPHFLLGWVQGEIVWRVKPRTAANLWLCGGSRLASL